MPFFFGIKYNDYYYTENLNVKIHVNTALFVIMVIFRIYHIERSAMISTYFMSDRAYRVSAIYGIDLGYKFALRSFYKTYPYVFCYCNYALFLVIYGYLLRAVEYEANNGSISQPAFTPGNSLWCSMMTMTTVGYGDFYPKTILGRAVGTLCAGSGSQLEALAILSFQRGMKFKFSEGNSNRMITSLGKKEKLKKLAINMLVATYKMGKAPIEKYMSYAKKHSSTVYKFLKKSREIRFTNRVTKDQINQIIVSGYKKDMLK
jgi:hypothetical protein